jgi:hypothetical protein
MSNLKPTEWEVLECIYSNDDKHYVVSIVRFNPKKSHIDATIKTIRTPYKLGVGQIVQFPKLM